ncbi:MAG: HD domain-containing protein [Cytophagales bacterium]|nr:HD domain-containing protein [Cytophagales bacterium]
MNKRSTVKQVVLASQREDVEIYLVGGAVRDLFLGKSSKDLDFLCLDQGEKIARRVCGILGEGASLSIHKNFGTAQIAFRDQILEFVDARKESYSPDSRKPVVEKGTLLEDQSRRDFTCNTMAISLNSHNYAQLIDPFNGLGDIQEKLLKTPRSPSATFSDDPLRMMRAIRFACQLDFQIDPPTLAGIREQVHRIRIVSQERITEELNRIMASQTPSQGFKLLDSTGLLSIILPEISALHGQEWRGKHTHKNNFYHTLQVLDNASAMSDNLWLRWAALLHDVAKPQTKRYDKRVGWTFHGHEDMGARMVPSIFKRFRLPRQEGKYVAKLVRFHLRPIALAKEDITHSAIRRLLFELGDDIKDLMKLCRADITSENSRRVERYLDNFDRVERRMAEVEEQDRLQNFQPPITGDVIMEALRLPPSREVGRIKDAIREAILAGTISNTEEEAYALMLQLGGKKQEFKPKIKK